MNLSGAKRDVSSFRCMTRGLRLNCTTGADLQVPVTDTLRDFN